MCTTTVFLYSTGIIPLWGVRLSCRVRSLGADQSFNDDAQKFLFPCAYKKFAWIPEVHLVLHVGNPRAVEFHAAMLHQPVRFAARWREALLDEKCRKALCGSARNFSLRRLVRGFAIAEDALKFGGSFFCRGLAMKSCDDFPRQRHLHLHRMLCA